VLLSNMAEMSYMIAYGMQSSGCTVLGNEIGKGDLYGARR